MYLVTTMLTYFNPMRNNFLWLAAIYFYSFFVLTSCKPTQALAANDLSEFSPVDYSELENWAAHPLKKDPSDRCPDKLLVTNDLPVDVFFIHPTSYVGSKVDGKWNANLHDQKINKKTDEGAILFQASAFNQAGNIYAPRYRQAHIQAYFTKDKQSAEKAFDFAYQDVKTAFEYFLLNCSNKPFIIASHSQGTNHAERLIEEFIDGKPLQKRLVAAYLIGMPVAKQRFKHVHPCENADETGCYVSWRTFKEGYNLKISEENILVTNPLSWRNDGEPVSKDSNPGSILRDFNAIRKGIVGAQVNNNILWANKPNFPGSIFFRTKNYHVADINFYYISIRENAIHRAGMFWKN